MALLGVLPAIEGDDSAKETRRAVDPGSTDEADLTSLDPRRGKIGRVVLFSSDNFRANTGEVDRRLVAVVGGGGISAPFAPAPAFAVSELNAATALPSIPPGLLADVDLLRALDISAFSLSLVSCFLFTDSSSRVAASALAVTSASCLLASSRFAASAIAIASASCFLASLSFSISAFAIVSSFCLLASSASAFSFAIFASAASALA